MLLSFAYLAFRAVLRLDRHNNAHHLTGRGPRHSPRQFPGSRRAANV